MGEWLLSRRDSGTKYILRVTEKCPAFGFSFVGGMKQNENDQQIRGERANPR
jgi:hypothetical protein